MFGSDMTLDLESDPVGLIVGFVTPEGEPMATKAWSVEEVSADPPTIRVLVPAGDLSPALIGSGFAVTGGDILTLVTIQLKGRLVAIDGVTDIDRRLSDGYCDRFFGAVEQVDGIPRELMERTRPTALEVAIVAVSDIYDQTPGPDAGQSIWTVET